MASVRDTVLGEHMIRKKKSEKTKFIDFARGRASELGYPSAVEEGSLGARNIVIGNPEAAEVVFTAHYDTPAAMPIPNFITPKNIFIYICYQMLLVFLLVTPAVILGILVGTALGLFGLGLGVTTFIAEAVYLVALFGFMLLLVAGPANKNTANDNSSGVITLLEIMERLPESERGRVAFIFFDLEEAGLIGSSSYKKAHSKFADRLPLINLDCVGDGRHVLLAVGKRAGELVPRLREAFVSEGDYTVEVAERGVFYPSDQAHFRLGVGVCALKRTRSGLLYMNKIHTKRDTVCDTENIDFIAKCALRLVMQESTSEFAAHGENK